MKCVANEENTIKEIVKRFAEDLVLLSLVEDKTRGNTLRMKIAGLLVDMVLEGCGREFLYPKMYILFLTGIKRGEKNG